MAPFTVSSYHKETHNHVWSWIPCTVLYNCNIDRFWFWSWVTAECRVCYEDDLEVHPIEIEHW